MALTKRYLLRDATGYYFQSVSGNGDEAYFTADPDCAYQFSKDAMASFRREYDYIKGRVVLAPGSGRRAANGADSQESK